MNKKEHDKHGGFFISFGTKNNGKDFDEIRPYMEELFYKNLNTEINHCIDEYDSKKPSQRIMTTPVLDIIVFETGIHRFLLITTKDVESTEYQNALTQADSICGSSMADDEKKYNIFPLKRGYNNCVTAVVKVLKAAGVNINGSFIKAPLHLNSALNNTKKFEKYPININNDQTFDLEFAKVRHVIYLKVKDYLKVKEMYNDDHSTLDKILDQIKEAKSVWELLDIRDQILIYVWGVVDKDTFDNRSQAISFCFWNAIQPPKDTQLDEEKIAEDEELFDDTTNDVQDPCLSVLVNGFFNEIQREANVDDHRSIPNEVIQLTENYLEIKPNSR